MLPVAGIDFGNSGGRVGRSAVATSATIRAAHSHSRSAAENTIRWDCSADVGSIVGNACDSAEGGSGRDEYW